MSINQIIEKYLTAYKNYGKVIEIWVNPTKKEMLDAGGEISKLRFIADSRTKKIYFANAWDSMHVDMWSQIKKETGKRTPSSPYNGMLMVGSMMPDKGYVYLDELIQAYSRDEYILWLKQDWLWTQKWLPKIKSEMRRTKKEQAWWVEDD